MRTLIAGSLALMVGLVLSLGAGAADGDKPSKELAEKIVDEWENLMRGKASEGVLEMYIQRWDRSMEMQFFELYPDKSLARIKSPAEDAGKASLKLGEDLWAYTPQIDQVQKIPPSLMLDSWMGSEFTNDDISRSSSVKLDYVVGTPEADTEDGVKTWRIPLEPKPDSPVVWDKLVVEATQEDHRPLRQEYYDENGQLARVMTFSDFRKLSDGRLYPYKWRMTNLQEKGRYTEIRVKQMEFKESLPESMFGLRNLKRSR